MSRGTAASTVARALALIAFGALALACGAGDGGGDGPPGLDAPFPDAGIGLGAVCRWITDDAERCYADETVSLAIDVEEGERSIYVAHGEPFVGSSCVAPEDAFRIGLHGLPEAGVAPLVITRASARFAYPSAAESCDALAGADGTPTAATGTLEVLDETTIRGVVTLAAGAGLGTSCEGPVECSGPTPEVRFSFHLRR